MSNSSDQASDSKVQEEAFHRVADERWTKILMGGRTISWRSARAYLKVRTMSVAFRRPPNRNPEG
jgi:hypothetical protein